jgi:octaprenyl-diphosphate synthase
MENRVLPIGGGAGRAMVELAFQAPVEEDLARVDGMIRAFFGPANGLAGDVARHVLSMNGKRMRPTMLLLVARRDGRTPEDAIHCGAVVELIHIATLIHDDSIDRSMLRRGLPTINSIYSDQVSIIMGDFVYSKAFALMVERGLFREMGILAETAHVMSRGEMRQLERKNRLESSEAEYLEVIDEKTASLFAAACSIGAILRGGNEAEIDAWERFGREYGRAFQITDDLFDFIGEEAVMGKARGSDIKSGRVTLPVIAALANATPRERARVEQIVLGDGLADGHWDELVQFIDRKGGVDYCFTRAAEHAREASLVIDDLDVDPDSRAALAQAVEHVVQRRR